MKKDYSYSGGTGTVTGTYSLFGIDLKPFIATLFLVTLVIAFFQIPHPYNPSIFLVPATKSSLSCPNPENLTTNTLTVSKTSAIPVQKKKIATFSATKAIASDPNKREFKPYGNAAALFVQMGAYRGGPYTFAVIGLASKPIHVFGKPWYYFPLIWMLKFAQFFCSSIDLADFEQPENLEHAFNRYNIKITKPTIFRGHIVIYSSYIDSI
jgi:galactan beta-1,4-galactosyltransferase